MKRQPIVEENPEKKASSASFSNVQFNFKSSDVIMVECDGNYCKVHLKNSAKKPLVRMPITSLNKALSSPQIVQIHRSYLINVSDVKSLNGNTVDVANQVLPISRRFKKKLLKKLMVI